MTRHSGSIRFLIEYIKLNQSHAVSAGTKLGLHEQLFSANRNGMVFINSGYPRNGGVPRNALLAFSAE
jgi:hypothetical protein